MNIHDLVIVAVYLISNLGTGQVSPMTLKFKMKNGTMLQYFHWYLPSDITLWKQVGDNADALNKLIILSGDEKGASIATVLLTLRSFALSIHNHFIYKKPSFLSFARMPGGKFYNRIGDQFQVVDSGRFKTQVIQF